MSVDLVRIVDSIHRDKNIPKDVLFEGIESALATAAKKHYPDAEEILVNDNPVMPLYTRAQPYLIKPWVRGYHIDPCGLTYDKDVTILPH